MSYDYGADLALGHSFEDKFVSYLLSKGINKNWIRRAPKDSAFSEWDIKVDFPVTEDVYKYKWKSQDVTYEIKRDRWIGTTNNICVEMYSHIKPDGTVYLGWFQKTKAKFLVIFDTDTSFLLYDMQELREYWYNYPNMWKRMEIQQKDGTKTVNWLASMYGPKFVRQVIETA